MNVVRLVDIAGLFPAVHFGPENVPFILNNRHTRHPPVRTLRVKVCRRLPLRKIEFHVDKYWPGKIFLFDLTRSNQIFRHSIRNSVSGGDGGCLER